MFQVHIVFCFISVLWFLSLSIHSSSMFSLSQASALPQLVSRVCHSNDRTRQNVIHILINLLSKFPLQVLWTLIPVGNSGIDMRTKNIKTIMEQAQGKTANLAPLVTRMNELIQALLEICKRPFDRKRSGRRAPLEVLFWS